MSQTAASHPSEDHCQWESTLEAALAYAELGWHVFPLKSQSKTPVTPGGFKDATTDAATIRRWWGEQPAANIGIACGKSGLVVVDLDVKNGVDGKESWHELINELGMSSHKTATVETPSGGEHIYFKSGGARARSSAGKLGPGIDIRASGGYVVAPPSTLPGGEYAWAYGYEPDSVGLLDLPVQLNERLVKKPDKSREHLADGYIPQGSRNVTLASLAGSMRREGLNQVTITAALQAVNLESCRPPLAKKEVEGIAKSISRYRPELPFNSLFMTSGFLAETLDLDTSQIGAYLLLLVHYWSHSQGPANDQREIQLITRFDAKGYGRKAAKVLDLFEVRSGRLYHPGLEKELQKAKRKSENSRRAAGIRWSKTDANAVP